MAEISRPEGVAALQRRRILAAIPVVLAEQGGYERTAVRHVIERAGVSRRTFYDQFCSWAEAFGIAYDEGFERFYGAVVAAYSAQHSWPDKVVAALRKALGCAAFDPATARMISIEPFCAGPAMASHHHRSLDRFVPLLREGRERLPGGVAPPPTLEQALLGAVAGTIAARLHGEAAASLPALAPELAELLLVPYLGEREPSSSQASSSPK